MMKQHYSEEKSIVETEKDNKQNLIAPVYLKWKISRECALLSKNLHKLGDHFS